VLYSVTIEIEQIIWNNQTVLRPKIREPRNRTTKIKNRTFAIEAAPAAIPKNPKIPAIIAITRKITVQRSIRIVFKINS
jgi:hypothetical protein